jgi:prepilin-type N-terminal cleavage/methylation domain-containing protein
VEHIGTNGRRLERGSAGFTLLELMIVVTIIGILLGVAVPTFFAARNRAADTAAKARAQHAAKVQTVHATDADATYATAAEATEIDNSVPFVPYAGGPVPTAVKGAVYVKAPDGGVVTLVTRSSTGRCFWTRSFGGVTTYASNDCSTELTAAEDFGPSW